MKCSDPSCGRLGAFHAPYRAPDGPGLAVGLTLIALRRIGELFRIIRASWRNKIPGRRHPRSFVMRTRQGRGELWRTSPGVELPAPNEPNGKMGEVHDSVNLSNDEHNGAERTQRGKMGKDLS